MEVVVLVVHLFVALGLIGTILLQRSEGGALGIGGGGTGGGLFSARGAANVLTRTTAFLAAAFFITSIALTLMARSNAGPSSIITAPDGAPSAPVAPAALDPLAPLPASPAPTPAAPAAPETPPAAASEPAPAEAQPPAQPAGETRGDVPTPVEKPIAR